MKLLTGLAVGVPAAALIAAGGGYLLQRSAMSAAKQAWQDIRARAPRSNERFDPRTVADQPEIARRYFAHAIAPGTLLASGVELDMRGTFILGSKDKPQSFAMTARQILRPPFEFVWIPLLTSGPMVVSGSDALVGEEAWTRFWLMRMIPVASVGTSADVLRSAAFRAATEGVWVPSTLLPRNGVEWQQTGLDAARVTITRTNPPIVLDLKIAASGALKEIVGQRWSNANPDQRFQLQPFGGTISGERTFGGYTIPTWLNVGNHFGTEDYLPFFQAKVTNAQYF